jgi:hypothetical protein
MPAKYFISGIVFVLLLTSCDKSTDEFQRELNQSCFPNSWIHTYQGDCQGETLNYHPYDDSYISTWRVRNRLELYADGSATYHIASPRDQHRNDAITSVNGTWIFDAESRTLMILNTSGEIVFAFIVETLTENLLILTYTTIPTDLPDPNSK